MKTSLFSAVNRNQKTAVKSKKKKKKEFVFWSAKRGWTQDRINEWGQYQDQNQDQGTRTKSSATSSTRMCRSRRTNKAKEGKER